MKIISKEYEAKCYIELSSWVNLEELFFIGSFPFYILFGDLYLIKKFLKENELNIKKYYLQTYFQNKLFDYYDLTNTKARIEKGAIIRSNVKISDTAIILMGAVINKDVCIGQRTMIDMNAVIGSGAIIKDNCHIGAGAVIAGVMEPISKSPVIIEDNVLIGANATILSGVKIGKGSIIGAGSVVLEDVIENTTVVGVPAKVINHNGKWDINDNLR